MAITNISVTQDNKIGDSDLLSVHNPVCFIATVTYDTSTPDNLECNIYDNTLTLVGSYRCIPYDDPSNVTRRFIFFVDEILKANMDSYFDVTITDETIQECSNFTKYFGIEFKDPDSTLTETVYINALHSARQFKDGCNALEIFDNDTQTYYSIEDYPVYVYCYIYVTVDSQLDCYVDNVLSDSIDIDVDALTHVSKKLYRYKTMQLTPGEHEIKFKIGSTVYTTHSVIIERDCNYKILKYLDKNGQYRFQEFNRYSKERANPSLLGKTNEFIVNLLSSQGNEKTVGFKNRHTISLTAEGISSNRLVRLSDIYTSPAVYYYVGNGMDNDSDWLLVDLKSNDNPVTLGKNNFTVLQVEITLPENFSIGIV